jgi:hypothetical protein
MILIGKHSDTSNQGLQIEYTIEFSDQLDSSRY